LGDVYVPLNSVFLAIASACHFIGDLTESFLFCPMKKPHWSKVRLLVAFTIFCSQAPVQRTSSQAVGGCLLKIGLTLNVITDLRLE